MYKTNPLWTQFSRALQQFRLLAVFPQRVRDHINIKELDSCLAAEEALAPFSWESARSLSLVDSQVSLGSLIKGRSSSFSLNSRLRSSLPGLLFFNLHPYYAYLASADNPADDPTRDRAVRPPAIPEPSWLQAAELGQFAELDRFLTQFGLDPLQLQGLDLLQKSFEERDRSLGVHCRQDSAPGVIHLLPPVSASSVPHTLSSSVSRQQLLLSHTVNPRAAPTPQGRGYLCLYSRSRGVAKAAVQAGFAWAVTFDWQHGPLQDLLNPSLQAKIISAVEAGDFAAVGFSPSCPSLCSAMRPAVRSLDFPEGLPQLPPLAAAKVASGNSHVSFVVHVLRALVSGSVPFWLENPDSSWLWQQPALLELLEQHKELGFWRFDHCQFGAGFKKRARAHVDLVEEHQLPPGYEVVWREAPLTEPRLLKPPLRLCVQPSPWPSRTLLVWRCARLAAVC